MLLMPQTDVPEISLKKPTSNATPARPSLRITREVVGVRRTITLWYGDRMLGSIWPVGHAPFTRRAAKRQWAVKVTGSVLLGRVTGFKVAIAALLARSRSFTGD